VLVQYETRAKAFRRSTDEEEAPAMVLYRRITSLISRLASVQSKKAQPVEAALDGGWGSLPAAPENHRRGSSETGQRRTGFAAAQFPPVPPRHANDPALREHHEKPNKNCPLPPAPSLTGWGCNERERKAILLHPRSAKYRRARQKANSLAPTSYSTALSSRRLHSARARVRSARRAV
jgi:hypothetical protein